MWYNNYIRIPFLDKGRTEKGADCWGLARIIYKNRLNIELPSFLAYENTRDSNSINNLYRNHYKNWESVEKGNEKEYDIIVFRMMGVPCHIGIVIGDGYMIHCLEGSGTIISNYKKDQQWFRKIEGIYRWKINKH